MEATVRTQRLLAFFGLAVLACGLVANEWVLAALSPDGAIERNTVVAVRVVGIALLLAGGGIVLRRRALAAAAGHGWVREGDGTLRAILVVGIVLRCATYLFQEPHNNDPHWEYVQFIIEHSRLPTSEELVLSFHPPLYFLLAVPWALIGSDKFVQLFSLLLSLVNLALLYSFIKNTRFLSEYRARCHALALTATLPQLVLFGNFISDDALSFPIGTLILLQILRYIDDPTRRNLVLLGLAQGAGLLTKGSFLAELPVLVMVVVAVGIRRRDTIGRHAAALALFGAVAGVSGCYKFVENYVHLGTPIPGNEVLQQEWVERQAGTYRGLSSLVDVNVVKLIREPLLGDTTRHSIPLLLYGTFWYSYIPESNFNATRAPPLDAFPRAIYLFGLVPTLLMLLGGIMWARRCLALPAALRRTDDRTFELGLGELAAILLLLLHVAVVVRWGIHHDAYSFFQSRLFFPSFFGFALTLGWGLEAAGRGRPRLGRALDVALLACYAVLVVYLAIEVACAMAG